MISRGGSTGGTPGAQSGPTGAVRDVLEQIRKALRADVATVLVLGVDGKSLQPRAFVGPEEDIQDVAVMPVLVAAAKQAALSGRGVKLEQILSGTSSNPDSQGVGLRSLAAAPLVLAGKTIGILEVASRQPRQHEFADPISIDAMAKRITPLVARVCYEDRESALTRLQDREERIHAVLSTVSDGIVTFDESGIIDLVNLATERLFGYRSEELQGRPLSVLITDLAWNQYDSSLETYRSGEQPVLGVTCEVLGRRKNGEVFPVDLTINEVGHSRGRKFSGILRDASQRRRLEQELLWRTRHDPLTGVANRIVFADRLEHALRRFSRHAWPLAILWLDLDDFASMNNSLGAVTGDEVLAEVASRLKATVRPEDTVARLGGDEFVVLCEELSCREVAPTIAARVTDALHRPFFLTAGEVVLSASVGVVVIDEPIGLSEALHYAESAMYTAKAAGKSGYALGADGVSANKSRRLELRASLHRAVERDELRLLYQPVVDLNVGYVVAAEALLRWQHPTRGLLSPAAFIHLAEESSLIAELDAWVMNTACRQAAVWEAQVGRPLPVWVNVSARTLSEARVLETAAAAYETAGVPGDRLHFEIAEAVLMRDVAVTSRLLRAIAGAGIGVVVDDVGAAYSSLHYLCDSPIHALKLDGSLLGRSIGEPSGAVAVNAVARLAAAHNINLVAERVETPRELSAAVELTCRLGQGFFLARPASPDRITIAASGSVWLPGLNEYLEGTRATMNSVKDR